MRNEIQEDKDDMVSMEDHQRAMAKAINKAIEGDLKRQWRN
jgi:hypothetical protein